MKDIFEKIDCFSAYSEVKSTLLVGNENNVPQPIISIVMPVYNHPDYFRQALNSAVNQNFKGEYEIIVVDNNELSEEPTTYQTIVEEFNSPKVLYYRNGKNIGMFGNLNRCIELARAPYITYLHDDDELYSDTLSKLFDARETIKDEKAAIFSLYSNINDQGKYIKKEMLMSGNIMLRAIRSFRKTFHIKHIYKSSLVDFIKGNPNPAGEGTLFNTKLLREIGGFNPELYPSSDFALNINYSYHYGSFFLNETLLKVRIAENESMRCYDEWGVINSHIYRCILQKIQSPKIFIKRYMKAVLNIDNVNNAIFWGHKDPALGASIKNSDKIVSNLYNNVIEPLSNLGRKYKLKS